MKQTQIISINVNDWDSVTRSYTKPVTARVRIEVDFEAIAKKLAVKAVRNKSGVAKEIGGAVVVTEVAS